MGKEEYRVPVTGEAKKQYSKNFNEIDWGHALSKQGKELERKRDANN